MTTSTPVIKGMMISVVVLAYAWPVNAADPITVFSVAVLKKVTTTFEKQLENVNSAAYSAGKCKKNPWDFDDIDQNFPMPRDDLNGYRSKYKRIFYECEKPSPALFGAFGDASLAAAAAAGSIGGGEVAEPVRVNSDTALKPPAGGGCSLSMCQSGTYRKTTNWVTCPQC